MTDRPDISYNMSGLGITLRQTADGKKRFKPNHAYIAESWKENWVSRDKKLKSQSIVYEHQQNLGSVNITLIGNNLMFDLSGFTQRYSYCPLTYMQLFGYAFGFLVDNHFIVPPFAKPSDTGDALIFKDESTGKKYVDNADVGILELVDQGRVTTVVDYRMRATDSPIEAETKFDSNGYSIEASVENDQQLFRVKVRSKGRTMVDALEAMNNNEYFKELSRKSDGKFLLLGNKLGRFVTTNTRGSGVRPVMWIPERYRNYDTFSECFRMMYPLTRIEQNQSGKRDELKEGDLNGYDQ